MLTSTFATISASGAVEEAIKNPRVFQKPGAGRISNSFGYQWGGATFSFMEVEGDELVYGGAYAVQAEEIRGSGYLAPEITQVVVISPGGYGTTAKIIIIEGGEHLGG